ncbi:enoyl-CoA hydratase domain-containing protein 2, mitochondrial isoform X1 [Gambusia affinis]|uniref:enoyl-CoA hydratase domain-containing protein 2, mitochondrial isoform X1 n=1 Tax=Gambusia affinis TaxID=33528 RepID=UPI001CDB54F4|nr:enoyl-CoA hydratase domain-containing protein 2, mitochondrial isoform X1 [Gambusia affinis]
MQVKILIMNERSCSLGVVAAVVVDCEQVPPSSGRNLQKTSCCPRPDTFFSQVALTPLLLGPKHRTKQKLNMASVLYRLAVPRCSLLRRLAVPLRETQRLKHHGLHRDGTRLLAGESRSLAACSRADSRSQHTAPEASVEVDLKRLEGQDEGIVEVLMCRHRARNALGHTFVSQMRELVSTLSHDSAVRVVIFRSLVPGVFCAGADLKERALMDNSESDLFVHSLRSLMTQIAILPTPTIAAMDGVALGGGLELALACDLRTASTSAQMGLIETTRGLLPGAGGSQRLPRMVGVTLAKELIFTGRRVGGQAALELGLVNRAVEQNQSGDAAYKEALTLAREILPQAPFAVRMAKEAINRGVEVDIGSAMAIERLCYARVIPTRDRREGMAAFIEKRPPRYTGE